MTTFSKSALLIVLAACYYYGFLLALNFTYKLPINDFAVSMGASPVVAAYAYLIGTHTVTVLITAIPIALVMSLIFNKNIVPLCMLISLPFMLILIFDLWSSLSVGHWSLSRIMFAITDSVKILLTIPLIAWLFSKYLPYNKLLQPNANASAE